MRRPVPFLATVITVSVGLFSSPVLAETTSLRVRVLPQNCQFDVIDTGTQELLFYTPTLCGQIDPIFITAVPPSVITPNTPVSQQKISENNTDTSEVPPPVRYQPAIHGLGSVMTLPRFTGPVIHVFFVGAVLLFPFFIFVKGKKFIRYAFRAMK